MDNQTEIQNMGDSQGVTLKSLLQNPFLLLPKQDEHEIGKLSAVLWISWSV